MVGMCGDICDIISFFIKLILFEQKWWRVIVKAKSDYFTIVVHHGGKFVYNLNIRYSGRRVFYFDLCHIDAISMIEINDMIQQLGYLGPMTCYWRLSWRALKVDDLRPLRIDFDVVNMIATLPKNHYLHVYLEEDMVRSDNDVHQEPPIEVVTC